MLVRVVESGDRHPPAQIDKTRVGACERQHCLARAYRDDAVAGDGKCVREPLVQAPEDGPAREDQISWKTQER